MARRFRLARWRDKPRFAGRPNERLQLFAIPLVDRQRLELIQRQPARPQPLLKRFSAIEMQPKGRNDRRLDLDANLQLRLTVRTHQTHLVTSHAALFGRRDADPASVLRLCRLARQA